MGNPKDSSLGKMNWNPMDSSVGKLWKGDAAGFGSDAVSGLGEVASKGQTLNELVLNPAGTVNKWMQPGAGADLDIMQPADYQRQADERAEQGRLAGEKKNLDYLTNYNKGIADDEAMSALQDAKAATRRKTGRQINFG